MDLPHLRIAADDFKIVFIADEGRLQAPVLALDGFELQGAFDERRDRVALGISHPCTTFDKWQLIHVVEDDYRVSSVIRTFF